MSVININTAKWNQTAKAKDGEGVETTVHYIGRIVDEINTFAVSVPPKGKTMYFCSEHKRIFKIGGRCQDCLSLADPIGLADVENNALLPKITHEEPHGTNV